MEGFKEEITLLIIEAGKAEPDVIVIKLVLIIFGVGRNDHFMFQKHFGYGISMIIFM
ncbi:MAG: hypothetical protein RIC80_16525 [Cyclobacteriaceae bacterium]